MVGLLKRKIQRINNHTFAKTKNNKRAKIKRTRQAFANAQQKQPSDTG